MFSLSQRLRPPRRPGPSRVAGLGTILAIAAFLLLMLALVAIDVVSSAEPGSSEKLISPGPGTSATTGTTTGTTGSSSTFRDVRFNWARDAIRSLVADGIVNGYPDGTFKPDRNVTRAEFCKLVARAFGIRSGEKTPFADAEKSWARPYIAALYEKSVVKGYPDATFRPDRNISRAEMAAMLTRVGGFGEKGQVDPAWQPSFLDVATSHWAFPNVEMAQRLDIIPPQYGAAFEPERRATRAETAWMTESLRKLDVTEGKVTSVDSKYSMITVRKGNGDSETLDLINATIYRNNTVSPFQNLLRGDQVFVVSSSYGEPRLVKASGIVTKDDVLWKLSGLTKGTLTPKQIEALTKGEYDSVRTDLEPALYERLVQEGLTPEEAASLLNRDWKSIETYGKDRLAQALSEEIGISRDLASALMARDWETAKTYAGIEVAQYVLGGLLGM